jgi:hypothetical protein
VVILFSAVWATIQGADSVSKDVTEISEGVGTFARETWQKIQGQEVIPPKESPDQINLPETTAEKNASSTPEGAAVNGWLRLSQLIVVLWAAISLFLPPKFNFKELISKAAVDFLCLIYYLNLGEQRNSIIGRVELLIDEVLRKSGNELKKDEGSPYRNIYILLTVSGQLSP